MTVLSYQRISCRRKPQVKSVCRSLKVVGGTEDWEMDTMTEEVDATFVCKLSCVRSDKNAVIWETH